MNRIAVALFALAILLAHSLAIHQTLDGDYAAPYDFAHVAYRVARNLVREGTLAWNPGGPLYEAYPSPLWVLVSAVAERLYIGPNQLTQALGTLSVMGSIVVLTQFSSKRLSGMIAPVLVAASGTAAAAGGSGTEAGLTMLLVTALALGFERGKRLFFAVAAVLLVWTRPEGSLLLALVLALELADRPKDVHGRRRDGLGLAFAAPFIGWLVLVFLRHAATGSWLSPYEGSALRFDAGQASLGFDYLTGFFLCSGSGILLALPILALFTGELSGTGRRMLLLSLGWAGIVALNGGDGLPFWNALAPVLPIFFLTIQEAITAWLDRKPVASALFWVVLVLGVCSSLVVSRSPTDLGPLRTASWHKAWMEPSPALRQAYDRTHGRLGLMDEIREVERLRQLAVYLRDNVEDTATISAFWPGTIGYLSRKKVHDMLGRATPIRGESRPHAWRGHHRVDLVAGFREGADFAVPILGSLREHTSPADLLHSWLDRHDVRGDDDERLVELLGSLVQYELLAVTVPRDARDPRSSDPVPFLIMRDRARDEAPTIALHRTDTGFRVLARHDSNQQVADLTIVLQERDGTEHYMRPTGEFVEEPVAARANLLIFPSGSRPIRLAEGRIPKEYDAVRLTARLHNPGMNPDAPLAAVGSPAALALAE